MVLEHLETSTIIGPVQPAKVDLGQNFWKMHEAPVSQNMAPTMFMACFAVQALLKPKCTYVAQTL